MEIRQGNLLDFSSLVHMLAIMHEETETIDPINWNKVGHVVVEDITNGLVYVAIDDQGKLLGSIGTTVVSEWYSDKKILADHWFYVLPDHRKSPVAFKLMKELKKFAKENDISVKVGHTLKFEIEKIDKFYKKLGFERTGTLYREAS